MADLIYTRENILHRGASASFVIKTKSDWSDVAWETHSGLLLNSVEHTVAGSIGRAQFVQPYGRITSEWGTQQAALGYQNVIPLNLLNRWVRIEYTPQRISTPDPSLLGNPKDGQVVWNSTAGRLERLNGDDGPGWTPATDLAVTYIWYGVVTSEEDNYHGSDASSGDMTFNAMSLEYLLAKVQITSSRVEVSATSTSDPVEVPRGLPFNGGRTDGRSSVNNLVFNRGHKTQYSISPPYGVPSRNIFQFARSLQAFDNSGNPDTDTHSAYQWSITEIVDYLLYWHSPTDANGPEWIMACRPGMDDFLYNYGNLDIETDNRTLLDILNELLSRRRGFTWWLEVSEGSDEIWLTVDSYVASDITLEDGSTVLPENARQYYLDWSETRDQTGGQRLITDSIKSYSKVVAIGAPFGSVFTLNVSSGDLSEDWTSTERVAYNSAFSGGAGYGSLDLSRKKSVNDALRQSEEFRHVYTRYKVADDWNEETYNGDPAFPDWSDFDETPQAVSATNTPGFWLQGSRIHPYIPLRERWDYTTATPTDGNPDGSVADYLRPIVVGELNAVTGTATTYCHLDRAQSEGAEDELLFQTEGVDFSCSITPLAEQPGLSLMPNSVPHVIGPTLNVYDDTGGIGISNKTRSQLKPDTIHATVYMTHDKRVQQEVDTATTRHNQESTLILKLGERAHYDVLCPQTVLGFDDDRTTMKTSPSEYVVLRDDRKLLQDIATAAAQWHSQERRAIEMSHDQIIGDYFAGALVTEVKVNLFASFVADEFGFIVADEAGDQLWDEESGTETTSINSLITSVVHDFSSQKTTVKTQFAELDFRSIV